MISHFYIHVLLYKESDAFVIGWRDTEVPFLVVERLIIDNHEYSKEYINSLLKNHSRIYRELERKLGYVPYSLKFNQPTEVQHE